MSALLGDKPYFMGETATWIDASVYAFVSGALTDAMGETPSRALVAARPNLAAYAERLRAEFYSG
nr:glutathione S-transferase C-terminal domain-containing protein [Chromobacterium sp. S0633]